MHSERERFAQVGAIVAKVVTTHANRFSFSTDAGDKGLPSRRLRGMKHGNRAGARGDHGTISKANPLAVVLTDELVARSPIRRLVLAPVGVDLTSDFGG
jgi:hypothetical protein